MPVLKNIESGLAEEMPQEALQAGTHEVPLISPSGEEGSSKLEDAAELIKQGYRQPNPEELNAMLKTAKHSSTLEQVATGVEGVAHGVLGPIADAVAIAHEVPLEDVRARAETNPGIHAAGEVAGLVGSGLAGVGLGGALNKVGSVLKAGKDASFIAKVAAQAGRGAIENALYQTQDEVSQMIQSNPNQTAESAISHVGMSALLGAGVGGGLGGVSESWNALMGSKAGKFLEDFKGMTKEHLGLPNQPQFSEDHLSPFYKPDIFMPEAKGYPVPDYASTPGGKVANAMIRNKIVEHLAGAFGALSGSTVGHPILGYLFGENTIGPMVKKILPSLIKPILDSEGSAVGLKSAVDYTMAAIKGEAIASKAAAAVFGDSTHSIDPVSDKERNKLKEQLDQISQNQEHLLNVGKDVGYYMPEHAKVLAETAVRNAQYLQSLKPDTAPQAPLDPPRTLNAAQESDYNRALDIAQNPLLVTKAIKDGSLNIKDIQHLKVMYPGLYASLANKLTAQLIDKKTDKGAIPYKTKLSLAAFMGQSLDSSMSGQAILASQPSARSAHLNSEQPQQASPSKSGKIMKLGQSYQTMSTSRERDRSTRH